MYNVSEAYRETIHSSVFRTRMTFTIDGDNTTYTDANILQGSFSITNQCTDTKDIKLGSVYVAELNATLRNVNVARQLWRGTKLTFTFWLETDENEETWEAVPLGVFIVSEAQWKASGVVIKAFDNMSKFDKPFSLDQSSGFLYDFLVVACEECDVQLAQTEAQIKALPNGLQYFTYYSTNDVETWRDLISYIAAVFGGFATINREGKLEIRRYTQTPIDTLTTQGRHTGGTFSDYVTKYTAISYTKLETKELKRYAAEIDDGATIALGGNPFLQNKVQTEAALPNILEAVQAIRFTPFNFTTASNPAFDLGDAITCTGGIAGTTQALCCVQKYVFSYRKNIRVSGFGADPALASARSKTDKDIAGLTSSAAAGEVGFFEYKNVTAFEIGEDIRTRVMTLRIAANVRTRVHFHVNINLQTADTDDDDITRVIATYDVNGEEQDLHPEETYIDGKHVLHLLFILPMQESSIAIFALYLTAASGTINIDRGGVWAYASGTGLVGEEEWNGVIDCVDEFEAIDIDDTMTVVTCSEVLTTSLQTPVSASLFDAVHALAIPSVAFGAMLDAVTIIGDFGARAIITEDGNNIAVEEGDVLYTE